MRHLMSPLDFTVEELDNLMVFVKETRWMATLEELRGQLDVVDDQIVKLYEERMKICEQVGEYKVEAGRNF